MAIVGYARVSTTDQDEALQVDDLQADYTLDCDEPARLATDIRPVNAKVPPG